MLCLQKDLGFRASAIKHICYTFIACRKKNLVSKWNDFACATLKCREAACELHRVLERTATMLNTRCC